MPDSTSLKRVLQRTLRNVIDTKGVGLHSGLKCSLTLKPAPVDTGIVFRRIDLDPIVEIKALADQVSDTTMNTTLGFGEAQVSTVEHLLSAARGLEIDNMYVEVTGKEMPVMDGSAGPFVFLMQSAGIEEQPADKKFIRIKKSVRVEEGDKWASFEPHEGFKVGFYIDFNHPAFKECSSNQVFDFSQTSYVKEISRARTFGFLSQYEYLREKNLALGASLDNTVVLDDFTVLNEDGLRYEDECLRHKVLDAIGDVSLLGYSILGAYYGYKSGHALNNKLLLAILADQEAWEIVTFTPPAACQEEKTFSVLEPVPVLTV